MAEQAVKSSRNAGRTRRVIRPAVLWFTGLSGSGKSTIADRIEEILARNGLEIERLDGDQIRSMFPATGFSREDRENHLMRVGYLASLLEKHGVTVIASFVSPYVRSRQFVRGLCKNFVEIYMSTPLAECERRDVKGLYKKARHGELKNFTGIDDPYEVPEKPEISIDTTGITVDAAAKIITDYLTRRV